MPRKDTNIEKRAKLIIKYRKMRERKKEKNEDIIKYSLLKDDARAHFHWTTIVRSLDGWHPLTRSIHSQHSTQAKKATLCTRNVM